MPGWWYRLASHVFEIPVEQLESTYNGKLDVSFHRGQYKLSSRNAVYSFGKHYTSFAIPFRWIGIEKEKIPRVLVLGFGLGSVINLLAENDTIQHIDAVDADPVILGMAKKYLETPLMKKIVFHAMDAAAFMEKNDNKYDLVIVDLFIDDKTPAVFQSFSFLEQLKNAIAAGGTLLFSKLDISRENAEENKLFEKNFTGVFPVSFTIPASGNKIYAVTKFRSEISPV